jgi:hypothetical protein
MDSSMGEHNHNQPLHRKTIQLEEDALLLKIEEKEEAGHKKEKDKGEGIGLLILEVPQIKER